MRANRKSDFPIFQHRKKLVYLDSAATSLKPRQVIAAEQEYYEQYSVNVHRGVYSLAQKATDVYEGAREKVRQFINAKSTKEIVFVRGATEGINLVAQTYGSQLRKGDIVLLSNMEHHANIVPWQQLRDDRGIELRWIPVTSDGQLDLAEIDELLSSVKLVAVTHMSNVLGTVNDVKMIISKAHTVGAKILIDAAQSVAHMPVDVQDLQADFLVFSGHKMLAPTGIGVLYAKEEILIDLPPYQRGGDMILEVSREKSVWNELPWKFEAGTPHIAGVIGLGAAIDYLQSMGMANLWAHEQELMRYGLERLGKIEGLKVLGVPATPTPLVFKEGAIGRGAIFSFTLSGVHPHDIGTILDERGIAVRAGHHCAMVLHTAFDLPATTRASCYCYNTPDDIDALVKGIEKVKEMFA